MLVVTPFKQNARILFDEQTRHALIVDPGGDIDRIVRALSELKAIPVGIVLTHAHIDHAGGVAALERELSKSHQGKIKLYAHKAEAAMRSSIQQQAVMFGLSPEEYENVREPDVFLEEGDTLELGASSAQVLFTPGHSPGHISLYFADPGVVEFTATDYAPQKSVSVPVLIGGDAIFGGAIGRTDLPGGHYATLMSSIREKIFTLPEETIILSGHGGDTTVGVEKETNPFFQ